MPYRLSKQDYDPYFGTYIGLVPDGSVTKILEQQLGETLEQFRNLSEDQGSFRYEPGKWSLKEVIGHISDAERIMSYRLLRIARGDKTPLPGFEQDDYVEAADFESRLLSELMEEYSLVRRSTLCLLKGLSEDAPTRRGIVNGKEINVLALAYIIAGHELHHRKIINERYGIE